MFLQWIKGPPGCMPCSFQYENIQYALLLSCALVSVEEHFQHVLLLQCVLVSIAGRIPACCALSLGSWVKSGSIPNMSGSSIESLDECRAFPMCPHPPLDPWVNAEHFQYILLLLWVNGRAFPTYPTLLLSPWANGESISNTSLCPCLSSSMSCSSIGSLDPRGAFPPFLSPHWDP